MQGWLDHLAGCAGCELPAAAELLDRGGQRSSSTRVLQTSDGWWALALPRADDLSLVPALTSSQPPGDDVWEVVGRWSRDRSAATCLERATLLGLAAATLPDDSFSPPPITCVEVARRAEGAHVLDLSALWAGPLAGSLLARCGMTVTKVESEERPDGLRDGDPALYERLNGAKEQLTIPVTTAAGREALLRLIDSADIVVESSRPRALRQLGIDCEALLAQRPGLLWLSITAYGRSVAPMRIGFGDDVAFGAGLVSIDADGEPRIIGDAIADPLTGVYAAMAARHAWVSGRTGLLDISMHEVARAAA